MAKDDRSPVNPFTGKQHYDVIDDDEFLKICYQEYYEDIQKYELLDDAYYGQLISNVALLVKTS